MFKEVKQKGWQNKNVEKNQLKKKKKKKNLSQMLTKKNFVIDGEIYAGDDGCGGTISTTDKKMQLGHCGRKDEEIQRNMGRA